MSRSGPPGGGSKCSAESPKDRVQGDLARCQNGKTRPAVARGASRSSGEVLKTGSLSNAYEGSFKDLGDSRNAGVPETSSANFCQVCGGALPDSSPMTGRSASVLR